MSWKFEWITSWDEVFSRSFQEQWLKWAEQSSNSHVFFHPALGCAWIDAYRGLRDIQPLFLFARQKDATIFFPLVLWRRDWRSAWHRLLIPLGYSDYDYHDPLVVGRPDGDTVPPSFWTAFQDAISGPLSRRFDHCVIDGIVDASAAQLPGWKAGEACPYLDLSQFEDTAAFLKHLRASLRGDLARQQRRLAEQGSVSFHVYSSGQETEARRSLQLLLRFHSQRWPTAYKASGFHERLLKQTLSAGVLHFSEIRLSDQPISWRFNFIWRGRHYSYMPTYDPEYASFSPAKVHMLFCYKDSIRRRLKVFDHLRGEESYKSGWAQLGRRVSNLHIPSKSSGALFRNWLVYSVKPRLVKRNA